MKNNYYLSIVIPTRNNRLLLETGIFKIIKKRTFITNKDLLFYKLNIIKIEK